MDERILKYFQNTLNSNERLHFLHELEQNRGLKKQFSEYQNLQALLNLFSYAEDKEEGRAGYWRFQKRIKNKKMHIGLVRAMKYAAAVFILIICTYHFSVWYISHKLQDTLQVQMNTLHVPEGQRARITLQDGTVVWLNAQSTLVYPSHFYGKERVVSLVGEGFFNVFKDKEKPFIVTTQDTKIQVLGTKFNVYSYPDAQQIKTSLIEGSVQVFYKGSHVMLRPNEESIIQNGKLVVGNIKNPDALLWLNGIYSFNNERLADIVRKLELYYDVVINIVNPKLEDICYTCKFRQRDGIEQILYTIQKIHHFKIEIDKDNNVITLK